MSSFEVVTPALAAAAEQIQACGALLKVGTPAARALAHAVDVILGSSR
jgi:hypothetical protein